jgi:hypothetical protein
LSKVVVVVVVVVVVGGGGVNVEYGVWEQQVVVV